MLKRVLITGISKYSKQAAALNTNLKSQKWQIHDYGDINNLELGQSRIPIIRHTNEVLVQVNAASINPIDLLMIGGYGRTLFQIQRKFENELPLTLGRDFSGVIVDKGMKVGDKFQIGDEVYGFIPIHKQGSFAQTILADTDHILHKPKHLDSVNSASLVYATMTAWSALFRFGGLSFKNREGLRVLILGASGGVGNAAVQLLKSQKCTVFATCAQDAIPLVQKLGADVVFDYKNKDFDKNVESEGRYHLILDCAQTGIANIPKGWKFDVYVTLNSPLLKDTDRDGLFMGLMKSGCHLVEANLSRFQNGSSVRWGFFLPSNEGFRFINDLIVNDNIKPVIQEVFGFNDLPKAFETLKKGHSRGKFVIDFNR